MKKTVNINLAGTFFHIDEDAFGKLSRYLDAIKRSLSDPLGGDEIIRDIEARIAELFSEKLESNTQVVSKKELDDIITIMGQPEDYIMDENTFEEDASNSRNSKSEYNKSEYSSSLKSDHKQLFRDIYNKFVAGVCSGLGHYLGLDTIWVRLFWILLTFITSGFGIIAYILFWILVRAAETTNEKLKMTGEPINISNIEKKFNEGYQSVSDSIKNAEFDKYGEKIKKGSASFFDSLGSVILTILKVFVKFFGLIILIVGLLGLISIIIGMFAFGTFGIYDTGGMDIYQLIDTTNTPIWLFSIVLTFAAGIPLLVLFILGLKIIAPNIKSIGTPGKITLFVLWLASLIAVSVLGIKQATDRAYEDTSITEIPLNINTESPIQLSMRNNDKYSYEVRRDGGLDMRPDENGDRVLYSNDIRLIIRSTNKNIGKIVIEKSARGKDYKEAKARAKAIDFNFDYNSNTNALELDGYFLTDIANKYRDQEMKIIIYLPVNTKLIADRNTRSFHSNESRYRDILDLGDEGKILLITPSGTKCLDCPNSSNNTKVDNTLIEQIESDFESWEDDVNGSLNIKKKNVKEVKVNDSLKIKEITITESF
jgi:phage shock protein PspC (stress-responsive transcriptional regulator)